MRGGTVFKLPAYRQISASFKLPPYRKAREYAFTFADATGKGDIGKLHGHGFPRYPNPCGGSNCPGTAFLYVGIRVTGPGPLAPAPSIFAYRKDGGFPGTTCGEAELQNGAWDTFGATTAPVGDKLTFDSAIAYVMGTVSIAVYCE